MANTAEVLQVTMVPTATENFKGKSCWVFLVLPLCPQEEILASGISLAASSGMLAFRDVAQLGSWNEAHAKLPQCLFGSWGTGALAVAVALVSKVRECEDLSWKRSLGLCGLP